MELREALRIQLEASKAAVTDLAGRVHGLHDHMDEALHEKQSALERLASKSGAFSDEAAQVTGGLVREVETLEGKLKRLRQQLEEKTQRCDDQEAQITQLETAFRQAFEVEKTGSHRLRHALERGPGRHIFR